MQSVSFQSRQTSASASAVYSAAFSPTPVSQFSHSHSNWTSQAHWECEVGGHNLHWFCFCLNYSVSGSRAEQSRTFPQYFKVFSPLFLLLLSVSVQVFLEKALKGKQYDFVWSLSTCEILGRIYPKCRKRLVGILSISEVRHWCWTSRNIWI